MTAETLPVSLEWHPAATESIRVPTFWVVFLLCVCVCLNGCSYVGNKTLPLFVSLHCLSMPFFEVRQPAEMSRTDCVTASRESSQ